MALDPNIPLSAFTGLPDIGQKFSNALLNIQRGTDIARQREEAPIRNRLLEAQTGTAEQGQIEARQLNRIRSLATFGFEIQSDIQAGDLQSIRAKTLQRIQNLPNQGLPTNDSQELLQLIDNPNISEQDKITQIGQLAQRANQAAVQVGALKAPSGVSGPGAEQRFFESLTEKLSPEDKVRAERTKLGLRGRATGSAVQTIAEEGTAAAIAQTEEVLAGGKEGGKLKAQLKFKPAIAKAVKAAQVEAAAKGETLTDLARSEAALPGLLDSVSQLKELAPIATSTLGGRVLDAAIKETGFGSTKGANARIKFISIINNQVLPLLRQTFGAAFTEREGETLKATMGDPDATPEQKVLQLESFIDQKVRNIQASQRELEKEVTPAGELNPPSGLIDNGDGTFTLPDGRIVRRKGG